MTVDGAGPAAAGTPRSRRGVVRSVQPVWERELAIFRLTWRASAFGALAQPLLFLVGMGVGVGTLVDRGAGSAETLGGVTYLAFVAPALIAVATMNVGTQDSLWPLMSGFKWSNAYRAMTATPLTAAEVAAGVAAWHLTRALMTASGVAVVLTLFDDTRTFGLVPAVLAGALTGVAFALPITAWSATREADASFPVILRFVIVPMFLFGGVFYPVDQLPGPVAAMARATPLWHGVELARGSVLGTIGALDAVVHVGVLAAYAAAGFVATKWAFARRLTA